MVKGQLIIQIPVMLRAVDQSPMALHMVDKVWVPVANEMGLYAPVPVTLRPAVADDMHTYTSVKTLSRR